MTRQQESIVNVFSEWLVAEIQGKDQGNVNWKRDGITIETAWWRSTADSALVSFTVNGQTKDVELSLADENQGQIAEALAPLLAA